VLGVPSYGHSYNVSPTNAVDASGNLTTYPAFTKNAAGNTTDPCGNPEPVPDTKTFADLISEGFLNDDGTPASGVKYRFDQCSQTVSLARSWSSYI
jgi:chitinase